MKVYELYKQQELPISLDEAWSFFSNPHNLKSITPPELRLNVTSRTPDQIYPGMVITYDVTPLLGLKMNWVTEITHVQHPQYFVDEQRFGPYKFWHHKHYLKKTDNGVLVIDHVHYALPLNFMSALTNQLIVSRQLEHIFNYRAQFLAGYFAKERELI